MTEFSHFRLDPVNQCLWRGAERISIAPRAFLMLKYLVENAGRLVTHAELLEALWPNSFVQPDVLKAHILDIRHILGDNAKDPKFIATHTRRGYRFVADVSKAPRPAVAAEPEPGASIVVLPFVDLDGAAGTQFFGDGLAEDVINELTKIPDLKVIARTSAFAFKNRNLDVRSIAKTLGVANVLEGSVRHSGNRVRVAAQLVSGSDGAHLWSGRYDRDVGDILTIQDEIAQAIADALRTRLRGPGERRPANGEAYQAYLEGRYYVQHVTPQAIERALECYQRAIELDPGYALPHSGLALQAYYRVLYLAQRPRDLIPPALASLGRALQLDPRSAQSHVVRGVFSAFYEYNWTEADEHFLKAREMDPASPMVRVGRALWFLVPTQRLREALAEIRQAVLIDPLSPAVRLSELWILHTMMEADGPDRARALVRLFPSLPICRFAAALALLRYDFVGEAATTLEDGLKIVPDDVFLAAVLARVRSREGRMAEARQIRDGLESSVGTKNIPFLPRAYAAEACGDTDGADELLNQAIDEREPLVVIALADRRMHPGDQPDCEHLVRKMNLA